MTLRSQLLLLFGGFAVLPLLGIGTFDYVRSRRGLESLLTRQTSAILARSIADLRRRLDMQESDLALLAGNAETQRWLERVAAGAPDSATARASADAYMQEVWQFIHGSYVAVRIRSADGKDTIVLGSETVDATLLQSRTILSPGGSALGTLEFASTMANELNASPLDAGFGAGGRNLVYDRDGNALVFSSAATADPIDSLLAVLRAHRDALRAPEGSFRYRIGGQEHVLSFASFDTPPWSVIATASLEEFGGPLLRSRAWDLVVLLAIVTALSVGGGVMLRRITGPLTHLTAAADRVAGGDLSPTLPESSPDEVGHLSTAFRVMVQRIGEMIRQVEASRQMAVLGEFAAQLAHEIRNPLTAIKINLQGLERDANAGQLPADASRSVTIALREVRRLDAVVHGALRLSRAPAEPSEYHLNALIAEVLQLIDPQATRQGVEVTTAIAAPTDLLFGDAEAVRGAVLNILLNALEAQPDGGRLHVSTRGADHGGAPAVGIDIRDAGPGISAEQRERIFQPFFSTKASGTGLGLPLAVRAVRAHGGDLSISCGDEGTTVQIILPLSSAEVVA